MKTLATLLLLLATLSIQAAPLQPEWKYRQSFCPNPKQTPMPDGTRADCIKDGIVWEIDFANSMKWYEAIGQSIHYAIQKQFRPGIVLITETKASCRYAYRADQAVKNYLVRVNGDWLTPKLVTVGPYKCYTTISGGVN